VGILQEGQVLHRQLEQAIQMDVVLHIQRGLQLHVALLQRLQERFQRRSICRLDLRQAIGPSGWIAWQLACLRQLKGPAIALQQPVLTAALICNGAMVHVISSSMLLIASAYQLVAVHGVQQPPVKGVPPVAELERYIATDFGIGHIFSAGPKAVRVIQHGCA
jgi:hypothetical protein